MTGAALSPPSVFSPAPRVRFSAALAASAFAHWILLAAPLSHTPWQGMAPIPDSAPMTVRLAPASAPAPAFPLGPPPDEHRPQLPAPPAAGNSGGLPRGSPAPSTARARAETPTLAGTPDLNYYPARDLDDYPRPLAPLRIDRPAHAGAGEVRLEILIDERGVVRDVVFGGPAEPGGAEEELRAALATTPFVPARRGGRPVRSRLVLSLTPGGADPEP